MKKIIQLKCEYCGNLFDKSLREYKRQIKKNPNARFFCNLSCTRFKLNKENPPKGNSQFLISDNRKDEFSQFRWFIKTIKSRAARKNKEFDLTVEFLKKLWEDQKGIDPFTGKKLILPHNSGIIWDNNDPLHASIDRIDNSKGYLMTNVRYVSHMANIARGIFSDEQLIAFCKSVTKFKSEN